MNILRCTFKLERSSRNIGQYFHFYTIEFTLSYSVLIKTTQQVWLQLSHTDSFLNQHKHIPVCIIISLHTSPC